MPPSVLLPQFLLPLASVHLGRFVVSIDEPHRDYHDPVRDISSDVTEKVQTQYNSTHRSLNQRNFVSQLTSFLSSSFSKRAKTSIRITADQVKTCYLNNTGKWFRDAMQSEETRKWIERTIDEGEDIYVVVGYHTLSDARIVEHSGGQSAAGGNLVMPVSTALAASGVVVPFGNVADPGLEASRERLEDEQREFIARGEQICAVQYRKIRHSWFSSNKLDKIRLAKETRWERYDRPRYLQGDVENMVEVDLDDEMTFEGEREECEIGPGETFLSAIELDSRGR